MLLTAATLVDDTFEVRQNADARRLPVLENDWLDELAIEERAIAAVSYGSEGGRLHISEDRRAVIYAPPADFAGTESFAYYVAGQDAATVSVSVSAPLEHDTFTVLPDGETRRLPVLANDPFWTDYSGPRLITLVSETALGGRLAITPDGQALDYTPPEHGYGQDTFVYIVDARYPAEVTVELPNPLQDDRYREVIQNSADNRLNVLANDAFWVAYHGERSITAVTATARGGQVAIVADGQALDYTPPADFVGWDDFRYVVDGAYEATVRLQVHRPVRDDLFEVDTGSQDVPLPLTENDTYSYYENHWITRDVIDRVTSVEQPSSGAVVTILEDGHGVSYSAAAGFEGEDTFQYTADGQHAATVTVQVTRPVRDDVFPEVYEDTVNNRLAVLANDFKGNGYTGPGRITAVSEASAGGAIAIAPDGRSLRYDPSPGFHGRETFTYTVDGLFEADVQVHVSRLTADDYEQLCPRAPGEPHVLDVLKNDHFEARYPGPAVITAAGPTFARGAVTIAPDGKSLYYVPHNGQADSFTYLVDGKYEASVTVRVRSHLMDDELRVDQNRDATEFSPLDNDFRDREFGTAYYCGRYQGTRRISAAGPSEQGGTVAIVDGVRLRYTPPPDFTGDDRFTYTVDGVMQAEGTVHVVRRVRDDSYRVDANGEAERLPVLVNDLFGADYRGAGQLTGVTESAAGAAVSIAPDGRFLLYAPPAGFEGEDRFTYTVDEALKADVTVFVDSSGTEVWSRFASVADFGQHLLDGALERYADWFGQPAFGWEHGYRATDGALAGPTAAMPRSHSETNVQVAGVDEGDIIETDGQFLYIVTDSELVIANAWPAGELAVLSRTPIEGSPIAEYLHGDRLAILSRTAVEIWPQLTDGADRLTEGIWPPWPRSTETWFTVYDISDPTAPRTVQRTRLDGHYVESRRISDFVFLVLRNDRIELPAPQRVPAPESEPVAAGPDTALHRPGYVYESREQYAQRMRAEMGEQIETLLPHFASHGPDGSLVRGGLLHTPADLFRPLDADDTSLVSVVSLNLTHDEPGISASAGVFTSGANKIYGAPGNLYIFDDHYTREDGPVTRILKFDWDAESGDVAFQARGEVAGRLLNQFSADESAGYLRIATTISNTYSGNYSQRAENVLFVLQDDQGVFEFAGGLKNLALDESIRSVRFFADRAFVTTFRDIDPLVAVDLSDPTRPLSAGHVTMPGFNRHLQLIDEDHLLAVGRNTPVGTTGPVQVSLYDVRELGRPQLLDQYTFERFSTSEAELDHHAFGWFAEHQTLAVPSARSYWQRRDEDGDGYRETRQWTVEHALFLFRIDTSSELPEQGRIQKRGSIAHDSAVRRSAFIENVLYSVADTSTIAADIHDVGHRYAEIRYDPPAEPASQPGGDGPNRDALTAREMVNQAKDHLSATAGVPSAQIVNSTIEAASWCDAALQTDAVRRDPDALPGYRIVLDLGESTYLYHTDQQQKVVLADTAFRFQTPRRAWHNAARPLDVNDDGRVTARDALIVINELARRGPGPLQVDRVARLIHADVDFLLDVNNDGVLAPKDALHIINGLHQPDDGGEGEEAAHSFPPLRSTSGHGLVRAEPAADDVPVPASPVTAEPLPPEPAEHVLDVLARDLAQRSATRSRARPNADLFDSLAWLVDGS